MGKSRHLRFYVQFNAWGDEYLADDRDVTRSLLRGHGRCYPVDQLLDAFQRHALIGHGSNLQHLIQVLLGVASMFSVALVPVYQAKLYVITDRSQRQIGKRAELVQGKSGVHVFYHTVKLSNRTVI